MSAPAVPSPETLVAELDPRKLGPGIHWLQGRSLIVHIGEDGAVRATRNRCRHLGGTFKQSGADCVLTCQHHGWRLDPAKMEYVNPTNRQRQPELRVERRSDDQVALLEAKKPTPWGDPEPRRELRAGEMTIRFYAHACCEITMGDKRLFTDPWLVGPAFGRGWWLAHEPPTDWCDRLETADLIFISHNHADHLNRWTLEALAERNPEVPIVVPRFGNESCVSLVERSGMRNVTAHSFDQWNPLGDARWMILRDGTTRDDSGLLIEYAGRRLLNTVDCTDANGGELPADIDVLLTSFAGGASGFPVCWEELFGTDAVRQRARRNLAVEIRRVTDTVRRTSAKHYVPFAGYFVEAHPADEWIRANNPKNTPKDVCRAVTQSSPHTRCWVPVPGGVLDLSNPNTAPIKSGLDRRTGSRLEPYLSAIRRDANFAPLDTRDGLQTYFEWAGFLGDLVLHILETDDTFEQVLRETLVDFTGPNLVEDRPSSSHRYVRMRVRSDVFRHVLRRGLPWEEITTGFAARLTREPDVYNLDFWEHFQDRLPREPPWPIQDGC